MPEETHTTTQDVLAASQPAPAPVFQLFKKLRSAQAPAAASDVPEKPKETPVAPPTGQPATRSRSPPQQQSALKRSRPAQQPVRNYNVQGFHNAGNSCFINAACQLAFASRRVREQLLATDDEFGSKFKAALQTALQPGDLGPRRRPEEFLCDPFYLSLIHI